MRQVCVLMMAWQVLFVTTPQGFVNASGDGSRAVWERKIRVVGGKGGAERLSRRLALRSR